MYKKYFGLTRNPFDLTPDPVCFVPTPRHNEALAALYHGVRQHKGIIVVTGEVGTGKTLLVRCLIKVLKDSKDISFAYVLNGRMSSLEFLQYILADLGLSVSGKFKYELLLDLGKFLVARASKKMTTVLIVDEAHHLSEDILEELRLLSNLETSSEKLLQIVLVGQPELDEKLDSVNLRQLKQRVAVRTSLKALDEPQTKAYVEGRLKVAGWVGRARPLFPDEAIPSIHRYSGGLPRVINTICENSLISAYARQAEQVSVEIIDEVAREFRLDGGTDEPLDAALRNDLDFRQAAAALFEWLAARKSATGSAMSNPWPAMEESRHE